MRKILAIAFLLGALLGGGCGDDDDAPQNGGGQEQQQEGAVKGTGYSFVPPDGWKDAAQAFEGSAVKIDKAYAEPNPEQGFANNVNIIRETPQGLDADRFDEYIDEFRRQASTQANDAGLSETEETELDGEPARAWELETRPSGGPPLRLKQVVAINDDALYTITWTVRKNTFEDSKTELQGLLDSWRWAAG